jgi:hypothetical protein
MIRAGGSISEAESAAGVQAGSNPTLALREEVFRKLADAIRNNENFIELDVRGGKIVES